MNVTSFTRPTTALASENASAFSTPITPHAAGLTATPVLSGRACQTGGDLSFHNDSISSPINNKSDLRQAKDTVKNKLDSLSEMGETESLRLQMAMDRRS